MAKQIYFEDVEVGSEITTLVKNPSNTQLFLYSAATRNSHRIHYDKDWAAYEGHPNILVHGPLQGAFLVQVMTDWIGKKGVLKKISYQNRARCFPGTVTVKGKVTRKYVEKGEHLVDCEIWDEQDGHICSPGTATAALPSKGR